MESMERSSRSPVHAETGYSRPTPYDHIISYVPTEQDNELLIMPKKIPNPVMNSSTHMNMQRELKINNKLGINVLGQKGELDRVFRDKKREEFGKSLPEEKKSDFQLMLEKRRKAQDDQERDVKSEQQTPEFLKIRNRLVKSDTAE
ncbi:protein FAM107B-like [Styela clava]